MPAALPIIALILEYGLKYGPEAIIAVRRILATEKPTEADWAALDAILQKKGEDYFAPKVP